MANGDWTIHITLVPLPSADHALTVIVHDDFVEGEVGGIWYYPDAPVTLVPSGHPTVSGTTNGQGSVALQVWRSTSTQIKVFGVVVATITTNNNPSATGEVYY